MAPSNKNNLRDKLDDDILDLSLMQMTEVPVKEIAALTKGTTLDLSNNLLTYLPDTFPTLTHLIKLDLSKNQLSELPEYFGQLKSLRHLDLYSNQLEKLPVSFAQLKSLKWLDLKNNPLVPVVQQAAGPCITASDCAMCAKKVVALLQSMQSQLERERQKHFLEEQRIMADKKREEEQERERIRAEKRAAKERRREEAKMRDDPKNSNNKESRSFTGPGGDLRHEMEKPRDHINGTGLHRSGRRNSGGNSCCWMLFKFLMGLMFVSLATGISLLWIYTNGHLDKVSIGKAMPLIRQDVDATFLILGKKAEDFYNGLGPYAQTVVDKGSELYQEIVRRQNIAARWMNQNLGPYCCNLVSQVKVGWAYLQEQISELWKWLKPKFIEAWMAARPYFQKLGEIIIEQAYNAYKWVEKNFPIYYEWALVKMGEVYESVSQTLSQSVRG